MAGPLEGVRILDCTEVIAAPYATALLSDMGAEVLKVEPVEGEAWRLQAQFMPGESRNFLALNRGKQGLAINLQDPRGQDILHRLVPTADVLVLNYRPDTPEHLGLSYETIAAINPQIIYAWNTAFGRAGPSASRRGYDIVIQAYSGLMTTMGGEQDGLPTVMPTALADYSSALVLAWGITAALFVRERTGRGQMISTSLLASAMTMQPSRFLAIDALSDGEHLEDMKEVIRAARDEGMAYPELAQRVADARGDRQLVRDSRANIYYRTYRVSDGFIAIGCLSAPLRRKFRELMGIDDRRFSAEPPIPTNSAEGRAIGRELAALCEPQFLQRSTAEWLEELDSRGIPSGPVLFPEELWDDEQVRANGLISQVEHQTLGTMRTPGPALHMSATPLATKSAPPPLGADNESVLASLGYNEDEIAVLRREDVIR